jgi:hypothetical protein
VGATLLSPEALNEKQVFVLGTGEARVYFSFALVSGVFVAGEAHQV